MSASVLQKFVGESLFTLSSAITLSSPFNGTTISGSFAELEINGGCPGVSTSVSGVLTFEEPGLYQVDSQVQILTPSDISSATGSGNFLYLLAPSSGVSAQLKSGQYVKCDGNPGVAEISFNASGIAQIPSSGSTLTPTLGFPTTLVSAGGAGTMEISAGGATNYRVKKLL